MTVPRNLYDTPACDRYRAASKLAYILVRAQQTVAAELATKEHALYLLEALGAFNPETVHAFAAASLAEVEAHAAIGLLSSVAAEYEATLIHVTV